MATISDLDFTVITPVFNGERYICETIESVLKYTDNSNFEYIVINDGSTDSTLKYLEKYKGKIKLINQENAGEASAVNLGLQVARGKYSLIVNADDPLCSEDLFSTSKEILDSNSNVVATYPDWYMIDHLGKIISRIVVEEYSEQILVGYFKCLPGPGAIFRTKNALAVGGRSEEYKFLTDYDFWLKLSQQGEFIRIPKFLAQWRTHENSTSVKSKGYSMALERIQVMENFVEGYNVTKELKKMSLSHAYYHAALLSYFTNEVPGRNWMTKAFIIRKNWIEKADLRIVLFCIFLPISRFLLPILNRTPLINNPIKKRYP
jgi:glycosyltransferase involved in cell wall biosynthesis